MKKHLFAAAAFIAFSATAEAQQVIGIPSTLAEPAAQDGYNPWTGEQPQPKAVSRAALPKPAEAIDERPLWEAIAASDWAQFDQFSKRMARKHPGWSPSREITAARRSAEADAQFEQASATGSVHDFIALAAKSPEQMTCAKANNFWRLADSYLAVGSKDQTLDVYRKAAGECGPDERLAAIQKTRASFPLQTVIAMIDMPGASKNSQEPQIRAEITKVIADMSKKPGSGALDARGKLLRDLGNAITAASKGSPRPEIASQAADMADAKRDAKTAEMLGWLDHKRGDEASAVVWFRKATEWGNSKQARSGLVYALLESGAKEEALKLNAAWGVLPAGSFAANPAMEKIAAAQKSQDWASCINLSAQNREDMGAVLAGAWCAYQSGDAKLALSGFKTVADNSKVTDADRSDAVKGWTVAARKLGNLDELKALSQRGLITKDDYEKAVSEGGMALFWKYWDAKDYRAAYNQANKLNGQGIKFADKDMMLVGWAAYKSAQCGRAWSIFKLLTASKDEKVSEDAGKAWITVRRAMNWVDGDICRIDQSIPYGSKTALGDTPPRPE